MKKPSWSCATCGATTTDPTHSLIVYFHMDCPGSVMKVTRQKASKGLKKSAITARIKL